MPVSPLFRVAKGGFTTLAGEIDHVARAGLAALRRRLAVVEDDLAVVEDDFVQKSTLTAKGSLYAASAATTVDELTIGADGLVLVADSGESLGVKWGYEQSAIAKVSQNAQVFTNATTETFSWDAPTATFDPLGWWAVGNPTRVTPDIAGLYVVFGWSAQTAGLTTITLRITQAAKNGSAVGDSQAVNLGGATTSTYPLHCFTLVEMNGTTDFLELQSRQNDSGGTNRQQQGTMTVQLVRPS